MLGGVVKDLSDADHSRIGRRLIAVDYAGLVFGTCWQKAIEMSKQRKIFAGRIAAICRTSLFVAGVTAMFMAVTTPAQAGEIFKKLNGSWSGGGSASFVSGERERLRCRARYTGSGARLGISLRCASASSSINLRGSLEGTGSRVGGSWSESQFGLSGSAFGSARGNRVRLRINGDMKGSLILTAAGRRHTFALTSSTSTLSGVRISMSRR